MDVDGYFLVTHREGVFDPESGADAVGSLEPFPLVKESISFDLSITRLSDEESELRMQSVDGEELRYRVFSGNPQVLSATEIEDGSEEFNWGENTDFASGGVLQTHDFGGIELARLDPVCEVAGFRIAGFGSGHIGSLPIARLGELHPQLVDGNLFIQEAVTVQVHATHLMLARSIQGAITKLPLESPNPHQLVNPLEGEDGELVFAPSSNQPPHDDVLYFLVEGGGVVELEPLSRISPPQVLGFSLPRDQSTEWLVERLLSRISQHSVRAFGLPVPQGFLRLEVLLCPQRITGDLRCIGLEIWTDSDDDESGFQGTEVLVARRAPGEWTAEDSQHLLDACVEWGVNEPYQIEGMVRREIDLGRVEGLVRIYDSISALLPDTVAVFADPPGRTLSFEELPEQLRPLVSQKLKELEADVHEDDELWVKHALEIDDDEITGLERARKVFDGLVNAGLRVRLDTLSQSLSVALDSNSRGITKPGEGPWELLERSISDALAAIPDTNKSVDVFAYREGGEELITLRFGLRQDVVELSLELDWHPGLEGTAVGATEHAMQEEQDLAFNDQVSRTISLTTLEDEWGFDPVEIDRYTRSHARPLKPKVGARMICALLQGNSGASEPVGTDQIDVFIDGRDSDASPSVWVWAHGSAINRWDAQ